MFFFLSPRQLIQAEPPTLFTLRWIWNILSPNKTAEQQPSYSCCLLACKQGAAPTGPVAGVTVFPIALHTACDTWVKETRHASTSVRWFASCTGGGWQLIRGGCTSQAHLLGCSRILSLGAKEMGISATPAPCAIPASGWEEHYEFITRYQCSSSPRCLCSLYRPNMGRIAWHPYICYCTLTKALPHHPHVHNSSKAILQRVGKLKDRDHLALAKPGVQPDVKTAIFCYLNMCFSQKTTTLSQ